MNFEKINRVLEKEFKLIEIRKAKKVIFVGDTHGDLDASQKVIKDYLEKENKIVFLGDYVDRGLYSKENLNFLFKTKKENPKQIFLLQGNHEGHRILPFFPANFWQSLTKEKYQYFSQVTENFPLVVEIGNVLALHGALPDVRNLEQINKIKLGSKEWEQIVWGDFVDEPGEFLGPDSFTGRPQFGRDWFFKLMKRFKKKVLVRSHQPFTPQFLFDDRCLTIFTSSAYTKERTIAIFDFEKEIQTAKDLEIITI